VGEQQQQQQQQQQQDQLNGFSTLEAFLGPKAPITSKRHFDHTKVPL
jgi:hypothetical protein